jgi:hypothetical protein
MGIEEPVSLELPSDVFVVTRVDPIHLDHQQRIFGALDVVVGSEQTKRIGPLLPKGVEKLEDPLRALINPLLEIHRSKELLEVSTGLREISQIPQRESRDYVGTKQLWRESKKEGE